LKILLFAFFLPLLIYGEDFISDYEYGGMLYENPRGVSCSKCHGKDGKGELIATYKEDGVQKELKGPDITQTNLANMIKSVNGFHAVMPTYSLTDEEINAIYKYIVIKKK
jgi:mono/diheme cytochrome c family protein